MSKNGKLEKNKIFRKLNISGIWKENDLEFIYEPVKFITSKRSDSFKPGSKSSHRILVSKYDSCDLSSILPKVDDDGNSKIIIVADDGFGKTSTLKFIFLEYKRKLESNFENSKETVNNKNRSTKENKILVPVFIDFEKLVGEINWVASKNLIEKIAEFLKVSPLLFAESDSDVYIFLFDNIDKVSPEKARNIIKDLKTFRYHFVISMKREFDNACRIDGWSIFEILPLTKSQVTSLIERIIENHNNNAGDKDKIEISNSKKFAAFLPFILLPAEAKKPHFISIYTEKIIKYIISEKIPEIPFKSGKLAPDETYKFLDQITHIGTETGSTFASIKEAREKVRETIAQLNRRDDGIVEDLCKITNPFFSSAFFFQKLFIKEFLENLLNREESDADDLLNLFVEEILDYVEDYSPFFHPQESDSSTQICFEYLAIIVRYLKNFYHEKYHKIQTKIFFFMKELYSDNHKHYFIRSNALWLMRLSYDIEDKNLKEYGEEFLNSVEVPPKYAKFEDFDLFYSELLFIMKCCLNSNNIKKVTDLINNYSIICPFSGLIFYLYLTYQQNDFASEIEPLLTAVDTEPKSLEVSRFSSKYSLVVRAIQAIGTLGNTNDIDIFIDHGFLDIYSFREFKENDYSSIERFSYYAIEELFYHKLDPNFDSLLVNPYLSKLREPLQCKIPYLFDDINRHISIYAPVCKNIDKTIRKTKRVSDRTSDSRDCKTDLKAYDYYLLEKSVMILTEISKQYFRDKSYRSQRGDLIVSLYSLNEELRKIHEQAGMYLIEGDKKETTLRFEDHTVKVMQEIVKSYTQKDQEDLIELSKISFTNWLENYQLKDSNKPFFSSYIKNSSAKEVSAHVVKSNLDIIERVMSKQLPNLELDKGELVILDIGAGVGNTSESVIEKYSIDKNQKKKIIYAVELLPKYVELYCNRMGITAAARYCYSGFDKESINYEVHIINEDIHKVLGKFCDEGKLYFKSDSWINADIITSVFPNYTSSAILDYLMENNSKEKEILPKDKEKYQSNEIYGAWLKWMDYSLNIYSGLTDNRDSCCKPFRFKPFDLIIANYSLHHLTPDYRKETYRSLLKCSSPDAFFAISDPNEGLSEKNRRYFNFTDEGVFACFMSRDECIKEVEELSIQENGIEGVKKYKWVNIPPENIKNEQMENGFIAIFQKKSIQEIGTSNPDENNEQYSYDVALSYASENREYVEKVANYLIKNNIKVFYDKGVKEQIKLVGTILPASLDEIYRHSAQYCVIFISKHYANSKWTIKELYSALSKEDKYIIPARFDDTDIYGIPPSRCYFDLLKESPEQVAEKIRQKIMSSTKTN